MRRRDFVRGLLALGVTAAVADKLAFVQGLGRTFPGVGVPRSVPVTAQPFYVMRQGVEGPLAYVVLDRNPTDSERDKIVAWASTQYGAESIAELMPKLEIPYATRA